MRASAGTTICGVAVIWAVIWLAASPVLAAAPAEPTVRYVVRQGDTLYGLADRYLIRLADYRTVQRRNHVAEPRRLRTGSTLDVPVRLLRTEPVEARLGAFRGPVTITLSGKAAPLSQGMTIGEGAVIATGANGFARLDLPDGSRVALPSQSQMRIGKLRRTLLNGAVDRDFMVEAGRGESTVSPLPSPQDRYIVRTPMSVSAVRGTEFHVRYDPTDSRAATEVLKGAVAVSGDHDRNALVQAGFGVNVAAATDLTPVPLPPAPSLLHPDKAQDDPVVAFDIAPVSDASAYRVRLASDAGFLDMFAEATAKDAHVTFDGVPDGVYFARASVIGADGLEGLPTTYAFERFLNTLSLSAPTNSQQGHKRQYLFRWEAGGDGSRTYRFQLLRDGAATPVIDQDGLTERQITITDLPGGTYAWRVMSRTAIHGRLIDKWSPLEQFQLAR